MDAKLADFVKSLPDPRERPIQWMWIVRDEHRNPDYLPDPLCAVEGCACGAAFIEVSALGVRDRPTIVWEIQDHGGPLYVKDIGAPLQVEAVRFVCSEGHIHDHEASGWALMAAAERTALLGGAMFLAAYAMAGGVEP